MSHVPLAVPTLSSPAISPSRPDGALVELRLPDPKDPHWIRDVRNRWSARVRLRTCRVLGGSRSGLLQVADVIAPAETLPAIERYLRGRRGLVQLHLVRLSPTELLVRTVVPGPALCAASQRTGAFCTRCRFLSEPEADLPWTLVVPRSRDARPILATLERAAKSGPTAEWQVRRFRPSSGLTARQADALEVAHRLGYYRFPRRGHLGDVGKALGVGRSTVAELLRRAEAKVVALSFDG